MSSTDKESYPAEICPATEVSHIPAFFSFFHFAVVIKPHFSHLQ